MALAFVLINTSPSTMEDIQQKIRKTEGVKEAYMVYGVYDIVAEIEAKTVPKIKEIVIEIRKINGIKSTLTLTAAV